ncbi:MAG TPA: hypothetical protein VN850_10110 [Candidatus Acidoferrales bacterium]|jgi:hypothetical protein|nr:hypothetical protein [Candidatus Acidoferrales bacterium]
MSIPPVGWEQNAVAAPKQPSPAPCSTPVPASDSVQDLSPTYTVHDPAQAASPPATRAFLNIVRHGAGPAAIYVLTYRRLDRIGSNPKPVLAEGARVLIELLEKFGVNLELKEVRGALKDIHRLGSANIPDLWLTDEQMAEQGLIQE